MKSQRSNQVPPFRPLPGYELAHDELKLGIWLSEARELQQLQDWISHEAWDGVSRLEHWLESGGSARHRFVYDWILENEVRELVAGQVLLAVKIRRPYETRASVVLVPVSARKPAWSRAFIAAKSAITSAILGLSKTSSAMAAAVTSRSRAMVARRSSRSAPCCCSCCNRRSKEVEVTMPNGTCAQPRDGGAA